MPGASNLVNIQMTINQLGACVSILCYNRCNLL